MISVSVHRAASSVHRASVHRVSVHRASVHRAIVHRASVHRASVHRAASSVVLETRATKATAFPEVPEI